MGVCYSVIFINLGSTDHAAVSNAVIVYWNCIKYGDACTLVLWGSLLPVSAANRLLCRGCHGNIKQMAILWTHPALHQVEVTLSSWSWVRFSTIEGIQAVKLCFNKIIQFSPEVLDNAVCPA